MARITWLWRKASCISAILLVFVTYFIFHDQPNLKQNPKAMKTPPQMLQQLPTSVITEKSNNGWELRVVITKGNNTPPIKYAEISLRGVDTEGKEFQLRKEDEKDEIFIEVNSAGTTATGFYILDIKAPREPVSVEVSRGGERQTFILGNMDKSSK